jgi:hypothetical protein
MARGLLFLAAVLLAALADCASLHVSARRGDVAGVHAALESAHVDEREHKSSGDTALHLAARAGAHRRAAGRSAAHKVYVQATTR